MQNSSQIGQPQKCFCMIMQKHYNSFQRSNGCWCKLFEFTVACFILSQDQKLHVSGRWRHKYSSSHIGHAIPYGEKFWRDKIFAVFADLPQTTKILTTKFYLQCKPHLFSAIGVAYIQSVDYFCEFSECLCNGNVTVSVDKLPKVTTRCYWLPVYKSIVVLHCFG